MAAESTVSTVLTQEQLKALRAVRPGKSNADILREAAAILVITSGATWPPPSNGHGGKREGSGRRKPAIDNQAKS